MTQNIDHRTQTPAPHTSTTDTRTPNTDQNTPLYHWTSFPMRDRPKAGILVALLSIFITYFLYQMFWVEYEQPLYYILGIFMWFIALMPFLVPTSYYFYADGLRVQYPFIKIERPYSDFGCFYADKMGIMLSTFTMPRRLDSFRGQSIRFSKTQEEREEIIEFLTLKIGKQY